MTPKKVAMPLLALGAIVGIAMGIGATVGAQTAATTAVTTPAAGTQTSTRPMGHAPIGGDGNVTAISGTTISMQEESDEGGAIYSIDASSATVTINGATGAISGIKVGDKIFVQGTVTGTNVKATSISVGFGGHKGPHDEAAETNDAPEPGDTPDAGV